MKFGAGSIELQHVLTKVGTVIPAKSTMPILENILFELAGNVLTVSATDLAVSLTTSREVKGAADGKVAVPAKRLLDTVRSLPDTEVTVIVDAASNKVTLTTKNGEYVLAGESAKEFPAMPPVKPTGQIFLNSDALRRVIHRTVFAVSTDELRPAMMGVLLQAKGNDLRAVSTDGHRLVRLNYTMQKPAGLKKDVIIPSKALQILAKSMEGGESEISIDDTHVKFSFDNSLLVSRLIDETYPNYESVIPTDNTKVVTVNREDMVASIRRVSLYASATTHQVRFDIGEGALVIAAQDVDFGGEAKEQLTCAYTGEKIEIGFNAQYLADILTHLESEEVTMRFSSPTRAGIVAPVVKGEGEDVIMLVMPVRLNT